MEMLCLQALEIIQFQDQLHRKIPFLFTNNFSFENALQVFDILEKLEVKGDNRTFFFTGLLLFMIDHLFTKTCPRYTKIR